MVKYNVTCPVCEGDFLNFMKLTGRLCPGCGGSNKVDNEEADGMLEQLLADIITSLGAEFAAKMKIAQQQAEKTRELLKSISTNNSRGQNGNTNH